MPYGLCSHRMAYPTCCEGEICSALGSSADEVVHADWDVSESGGQDSTAMSRRSGPSSGFILNKPCLNKRVQEINLRAGLAGIVASICPHLPER